ncbi:MAG: ABC transporter ATP-binding protein [Pseudomonadota bacterium]
MLKNTEPAVAIDAVRKAFGAFVALDNVSFDIADNEFFTLLGPSGCGKTTLLRLIAGFEEPSAGRIFLYGDEIEQLPPNKRPVNTVFQNYALFPHMGVTENIGFGLKMLGWDAATIDARVAEMVETVRLQEFVSRKPSQMSGGQQQRVALARAMAPRPKVLLLDEPLSALDLKLRQGMREELKRLQKETGITFVFVTHDQEEALSMSDRIAVMSAGRVQQVGDPGAIYEAPANRFVADFIGDTNLIDVTAEAGANDGIVACRLPNGAVIEAQSPDDVRAGQSGTLSIRPERLIITAQGSETGLQGQVTSATYLGTDTQYEVALGQDLHLRARQQNQSDSLTRPRPGDTVSICLAQGAARFLVR